MKKTIIILILALTFILSSCETNILLEDINTAYKVGDEISLDDFKLTVSSVFINELEQAKNENENLLYIYVDYPKNKTILSKNVYLNTLKFNKITYYSIDGLDYLGGTSRAEDSFIRFSVPKNNKEFILYINESIRIYINIEE